MGTALLWLCCLRTGKLRWACCMPPTPLLLVVLLVLPPLLLQYAFCLAGRLQDGCLQPTAAMHN